MHLLSLLGPVNGSSEPATRNLSQNPRPRITRFPMRPTCVMSEEKVSNPLPTLMSKFLTLSCVMCSKLQPSSNLSASRGISALAKWHKVRLHLTMLWRQPIHQRASWSPIAGATNVGSELLLALPEDLKGRPGTESRKTRAPAINKAYIPLFHSSPRQKTGWYLKVFGFIFVSAHFSKIVESSHHGHLLIS